MLHVQFKRRQLHIHFYAFTTEEDVGAGYWA
jgi:hypothetical protein